MRRTSSAKHGAWPGCRACTGKLPAAGSATAPQSPSPATGYLGIVAEPAPGGFRVTRVCRDTLRPQDTATLAERVVGLHGGDARVAGSLVAMHYETSEADLQAGLALQQALQAALVRDGLGAWVGQ